MSIGRIRFAAIALALLGSGVAISLLHAQGNPPWNVGDVFVAVGKGQYEVRDKTGSLKQTITSSVNPKKDVAGCWFDSQFNLYTADFYNTKVVKYDITGSHASSVFADTNAQAPNGNTESIVMAVNGDVYAGHAVTGKLLRYRSDGAFLASYTPALESGATGVDWIDLSTDQKTIFFTSRGRDIRKFDVATAITTTLTTLGAGGQAFAIRLLGPSFNGSDGLLVADNVNIKQLNSAGGVIATYDYDPSGTANDENSFRALNLDPDGVHFWAGGFDKGRLYRFTFGSSAPDSGFPINTGAGNSALGGLCVMGEPQTQVVPLILSNSTGSTVLKDVTAPFGNPTATGTQFYSYSTWRLRINVKANQSPIVAAVSFTPQSTSLSCESNNSGDSSDFDCRFRETPAQCVPFFNDPSVPSDPIRERYRCAFYRVKDMPTCSAASPGTCPFQEQFVPGTNDLLSEIIMNLTNPPSINFNVTAYGPAPKGNPRIMRDPDSVNTGVLANQFFIDATTAVIDWPSFGTGTPNDYSPVQRITSTSGTACAVIISPTPGSGKNGGSSMKLIIEVRTLIAGQCTGPGIEGASSGTNNLTLAISGGPQNALVIYCDTPGNSLGCFTPVNGQPGRYQSTIDLTNPPFVPSTQVPYFFAVTSVNVPSADPTTQNAGIFPPIGANYFICPSGSNCGS